jgi:hypothetical protein
MTRVWLTGWEWGCCGDPFAVGGLVDFGIASRSVDNWLVGILGATLAGTVDAVESHHEEEFPDRVRGVVEAVYEVSQDFVDRRELRRPGRGARRDAVAPDDGEEWPPPLRELSSGVFIGTYRSRYIVVSEPVPGTAALHPVRGVRVAAEPADTTAPDEPRAGGPPPESPVERRTRRYSGWLVDVDES